MKKIEKNQKGYILLRQQVGELSTNIKALTSIVESQHKIIEALGNRLYINPINFHKVSSISSSGSSIKIKSDSQVPVSKLSILPPRPEAIITNTNKLPLNDAILTWQVQNWEIINTALLSKEQKDAYNLIKRCIKHASDNNIAIQPSIEDYESTKIGDFISDSKKFTNKITNFAKRKD